MAKPKKPKKIIKLHIEAGKANPAPPVGPALGAAGVNIMAFCKAFNAQTQDKAGDILPVVIEVDDKRDFTFITKEPPMAQLLKKELGIAKGSGEPNKTKVGTINREQAEKIATRKMPDLNANDMDAAVNIVFGTARQMGLEIKG